MPIEGGDRDEMVAESFYRMLRDALEARDWFDPDRAHLPINYVPEPIPPNETVPMNTFAISWEDAVSDPAELGSNATKDQLLVFCDFYAQNESIGLRFTGDIVAILQGQMPSAGREHPVLDVYDWSLATPAVFTVAEIEDVERARAHRYDQPWERFWFGVSATIMVDR